MQYRPFGKLDWKGSALGFGAMRLPVINRDQAKIDEDLALEMIRTAIDQGVNYVDTAFPYHGGQSEIVVGKALAGEYREKVKLATKAPTWLIQKQDDFDRYLEEQLKKLNTNRIDFYLLHGLNKQRWPGLKEMNIFKPAEKAMADGRIGYFGFSFHDDLETFKGIVDDYDNWTFAQIQYNFMDTEYQAGTEGLQYAAAKGLAMVIMEPVRGGQLAKRPPDGVARIWEEAKIKRSSAEWALQWIWNQPEVAVVLSGMSTMEQVKENLESANRSGVGNLSPTETNLIQKAAEAYRASSPILCTQCQYCMPCPNGVNIPGVFGLYNDAMIYNDVGRARMLYQMRLTKETQAHNCVACGECLEKCPQSIEIIEWLKKADETLVPKQA
ncbi:MAG: aldo/keto reductase [Desulfobacteraceae bacterium]|nr:aldo/keto reductase [Desulfobacteraceae bacterium]MBU4053603.1 aldo/keto reductase [Pseudomonadota bacterium]